MRGQFALAAAARGLVPRALSCRPERRSGNRARL